MDGELQMTNVNVYVKKGHIYVTGERIETVNGKLINNADNYAVNRKAALLYGLSASNVK